MKPGKIIEILADIFFPRACLGCRRHLETGIICADCFATVPVRNTFFCGTCEARIPATAKICHPETPALFGAAGFYDDPVLKTLIHNLKFRNIREAAGPLAELMAKFISQTGLMSRTGRGEYNVVPVPLSRGRFFERGYNQAEEIARRLAGRLSLPLLDDALIKTKFTKAQAETKNLAERRKNLAGCFAVKKPEAVHGKKILLIDDVTTSGTTFMEAASALKKAGARKIIALAAAKA
ncbi:MAG: ComF family protein [Patescibacteria group bacterium]|nr:ComF family protein [Patescibacteria group bacterium]